MQPEIDYVKIGQRIKAARLEKGYRQADLGALVGCSNNHMSHIEVGQTKVSLAMLLKLAFVLEKDFDFFLLDTPYAKCDSIINAEIADRPKQCNATTLITISKIIDALIEQQNMISVLFCNVIYRKKRQHKHLKQMPVLAFYVIIQF